MTDDVRAAAERITRSVHEAVYTGPLSLQGKLADALIVADVSKTVAEWAESSTASYKVAHRRLQRGWTPEEAVFGRGQ